MRFLLALILALLWGGDFEEDDELWHSSKT